MPTQKIDPKVIFASDAPAIDKPPVFSDKTKGWDVARANDGRPQIKEMNKMQQDTDLKILWLNENAVLPYDASIDYPDGAVALKDGSFKQLSSGSWAEFLDDFADKDAVKRGIANRYDSSLVYNSGERVILTNGDIVKSTIGGNTNDPNVNMAGWVRANDASQVFDESGKAQQEVNNSLKSSVFYHIDSLEDAQKYLGYIVEYNGKHFEVSVEQSKDLRHPVIRSGDAYLIPYDQTSVNFKVKGLSTKVGELQHSDFSTANPPRKSQQAVFIDNVNQRAFITSVRTDLAAFDVRIKEYDFTGGILGTKIAEGVLSMGHGDFFAMTLKDGIRTIWFHKPAVGGTQYSGGGSICGATWSNGCTDADIHTDIDASTLSPSARAQVTNYDDESLLIRGADTYVVDLDDLYAGVITKKEVSLLSFTPQNIYIVNPVQQFGVIAKCGYALSGLMIKYNNTCYYACNALDDSAYTVQTLHNAEALHYDEVEGLGYLWNTSKLQFEPIISTWEHTAGIVRLFNISHDAHRYKSQFTYRDAIPADDGSQWGASRVIETPTVFSASKGLLIGGSPTQVGETTGKFYAKPEDFSITQWTSGQGGRYGARIAYKTATQILIDDVDDSTFPQGFRFTVGGTKLQLTSNGLNVGHSIDKTKSQVAGLNIINEHLVVVRSSSGLGTISPAFVAALQAGNGEQIHYATENLNLNVGRHYPETQTTVRWVTFNASSIRPATTGTLDLGISSLRFKKGWFNQLNIGSLSVYADNAAAVSGGLVVGDVYRTAAGQLMIVY